MSWFNDDLDRTDASVFSSDALESYDNRKELRAMCERWLRALNEHEARDVDSSTLLAPIQDLIAQRASDHRAAQQALDHHVADAPNWSSTLYDDRLNELRAMVIATAPATPTQSR